MGKPGPQKINRYGVDFKLKAVQMSGQPGVLIKDVVESLCIHPFMLSKWRKQVRDGELDASPAYERAATRGAWWARCEENASSWLTRVLPRARRPCRMSSAFGQWRP